MTRWNPKTVTEAVERAPIFVVPSGEREAPTATGFRIRVRGDTESAKPVVYRCPVHGVFEVRVRLSEMPDVMPCTLISWDAYGVIRGEYPTREEAEAAVHALGIDLDETRIESGECSNFATWAGSSCGIGHAAGEVMS